MLQLALVLTLFLLFSQRSGIFDAACRALGAGLVLSGLAHYLQADWYVSVMAEWIPQQRLLVQVSAGLRILFGLALWIPVHLIRHIALLLSLLLLCMVLPVNLRIALAGDQIAAVQDQGELWRWLRLAGHLGWIFCIIGTLESLRVIYNQQKLGEPEHCGGVVARR
ncbi:MAG: hypothetical protein KDB14_05050 [Planctomycetales bacterium]|nr:hypothetical protein [Planctomycetales bacterium]